MAFNGIFNLFSFLSVRVTKNGVGRSRRKGVDLLVASILADIFGRGETLLHDFLWG